MLLFAHMFLVHLCLQLTVDGFAIDKMAAEVKVRASRTHCLVFLQFRFLFLKERVFYFRKLFVENTNIFV